MSSFVVENSTINRIITWLNSTESLFLRDQLKELGFSVDVDKPFWGDTLGQAMFQMNVDAVNGLYEDREESKFGPEIYRFRWEPAIKIQAYKSLSSWLYQCSVGDIVNRPLYKFFREVVKPFLADEVITRLPEWQRATWG